MAFQDPFDPKITPFNRAVFFHCLDKVSRTRWVESTRWRKKRRYTYLIKSDKQYKDLLEEIAYISHFTVITPVLFRASSKDLRTCGHFASLIVFLAMKIKS